MRLFLKEMRRFLSEASLIPVLFFSLLGAEVVNAQSPVTVSTWKDGHRGALSISVDDCYTTCYSELTASGFKGTYFCDGTSPSSSYANLYNDGMELGAHTANHLCYELDDNTLRFQELEPNIDAICAGTPQPCNYLISFAWPCGYTNSREEDVASDYFLSARGYNINQLEDPTPSDFMNLKSFNSHVHKPYPPYDLKTVVDAAEQQGKWAILVFHAQCDDDNAISHAASKDMWVAPIGTVIKYILQRDKFILENYTASSTGISFSFYRLDIGSSPEFDFETAFSPSDVITLTVDIDDSQPIASVRLNGVSCQYKVVAINENNFLLINTPIFTTSQSVEVIYQGGGLSPVISVSPSSLQVNVAVGTNPTNNTLSVSNAGGGTLSYTISDDASWLSCSPASGTSTGELDTITVTYSTSGLAAGIYTAAITIAASGASNSPQTIPVTLTVSASSTPAISRSPVSLSPSTSEGANASSQSFLVSNAGGGTLSYTISDDASWLSCSPASGTSTGELDTITVTYSTSGLVAGIYTAAITIAASGASNSPQTIPVTLTVSASSTPAISRSPVSLSPSTSEGANASSQSFLVSNAGGGTLSYTISDDASWLSCSPASGTSTGELDTITVTYSTSGLVAGIYTAAITIAASGASNSPQTIPVTLTVNSVGAGPWHYDFTYPDRTSLLEVGWDFDAVTASGSIRNTEQTTGAVVSYDQAAHPGVLRIPCDVGDLWRSSNNTRNTLFRDLPANWTSIRLKLSFAPTQNYQQAGLVAYQNDDNYVLVTRNFSNGNYMTFAREAQRSASIVKEARETSTQGLVLRLDRELVTEKLTGYYSLDGASWVSLGAVTQALTNPRLGIFVGASPSGFPPADIQWAEVMAGVAVPAISRSPVSLSPSTSEGANASSQSFLVSNAGGGTLSYTISDDASWLSCSPASGTSTGELDTITVTYSTSGLAAGIYTAAITIAASGASNSPQTIPVTLTVSASSTPAISRSPVSLSPSTSEGANASSQSFLVSNAGGGTLSYTISDDASWLSCSPASGTSTGELDTITVTYSTSGLVAGIYTAAITIAASGASNSPQTIPVTLTVNSVGAGPWHYDFTYPDRTSLLEVGWDFDAVTASGSIRNTEQTTGAVVSYDQAAHPGVLRIPCDVGDLWRSSNNTRNTLFRDLPANWTSIRLKLSFAPTQNYQQAGLVAYQNDDNYVLVTRNFSNGNYMTFAREAQRSASIVKEARETSTQGLVLRLDRELVTEKLTGYYSLDGASWVSLGAVTQALTNPRLGIFVGASPSGFPPADIQWAEVMAGVAAGL